MKKTTSSSDFLNVLRKFNIQEIDHSFLEILNHIEGCQNGETKKSTFISYLQSISPSEKSFLDFFLMKELSNIK